MTTITDVKPVSAKASRKLLYEENERLRAQIRLLQAELSEMTTERNIAVRSNRRAESDRERVLARIGELDIAVRHMANPANYREGTPWLVVDGVVYHPAAFSTAALNGEPLRGGTVLVEVNDGT